MLFTHQRRFLSPNSQAGDGGNGDSAGAGQEGEGKETSKAKAKDEGKSNDDEPMFTQADLERVLTDRLARQEKKLKREFEQTQEQARTQELEDTAQWQELAQKRQGQIIELQQRVDTLEKAAETAAKNEKSLLAYVDKLKDGVPESILGLLEGKDAADQLEWLTANAESFLKGEDKGDEEGESDELTPTPPPSGDSKMTETERRRMSYQVTL